MQEGVDCPAHAASLNSFSTDEQGIPMVRPRMACLFEMLSGGPAWRHFEEEQVWGRPMRTLVLRTAAVIGNYDYLLDWRFEQDGSIRVAVGATGIIEAKAVKEKMPAMDQAMGAAGQGGARDEEVHFVGDKIIAVNHDH